MHNYYGIADCIQQSAKQHQVDRCDQLDDRTIPVMTCTLICVQVPRMTFTKLKITGLTNNASMFVQGYLCSSEEEEEEEEEHVAGIVNNTKGHVHTYLEW